MDQVEGESTFDILQAGEQVESTEPEAVEESVTTPELSNEPGEAEEDNQPEETQDKPVEEVPEELFTELTVGDETLGFKTKEDFDAFVEANPTLKEGFLRMADYTRKTQELAEEKKNTEAKEDESFWTEGLVGAEPPNEQSKQALAQVWKAFQSGDQNVAKALNDLTAYVSQNKPLVQSRPVVDPQLMQEVSGLKSELQELKREQRNRIWSDWKSKKESTGTKIDQNVENLMYQGIMNSKNEKGQPTIGLDEAYDWAMYKTGRVTQRVIRKSKAKASLTPKPPSSASSADSRPEPTNTLEALQQGLSEFV